MLVDRIDKLRAANPDLLKVTRSCRPGLVRYGPGRFASPRAATVYSTRMPRSLWTRIARAVFGLLSIWCLGCTAFDPIVDRLIGAGEASRASCMTMTEGTSESATGVAAGAASVDEPGEPGCGCTHCASVQAPTWTVAVVPHATPETAARRLGSALTDDREPSVPPPVVGAA